MKDPTDVPTFAEYLTVGEAAKFLGLSPWTLRNWDNTGKLKPARHPISGYRLYRREDLVGLLQSDQLSGRPAHTQATERGWNGIGIHEHCIQLYENGDCLVQAVTAFIGPAIVADGAVMLIVMPHHLEQIEALLRKRGLDLARARQRGQCLILDLQQTLDRILSSDDAPDLKQFEEIIAAPLRKLTRRWSRGHVVDEMMSSLWEAGHPEAARLLGLAWQGLVKQHPVARLCPYPSRVFQDESVGLSLEDVCEPNVRVIGSGDESEISKEQDPAHALVTLQYKTQRLEDELARLRQAEHELHVFVEEAAEGAHKISLDGIILWANQAELELLGYSWDDYVGRPVTDIHADRPAAEEMLRRLAAGEKLHNFPARLRCRDGSTRDVLININACVIDGQTRYYRGFIHDVTGVHHADHQRAMLAAIVESSEDAIISKTLDGVILSWNAGAERLFEYTAEEAIGKSVTLIIPPERLNEEIRILRSLRRGDRIKHFETVRVSKSGRMIDISLTISPIRDGYGNLIGASKVARDITERMRADAALRRSEEQYRRLAEMLPVAAYTCDADGTITYFNQRAVELWGREPVLGQEKYCGSLRLYDVDGNPVSLDACHMARALREGRSVRNQEGVIERPDGSRITVLANIDPIREPDGCIVGAINVFGDITRLKEVENALREADRRKDEFLATLAHELRNPLAPIRNSLNILKRTESASPAVQHVHSMMERQVAHLVRLVDDLLELSRISRGKIELKKEPILLENILQHALETSQPLIEAGEHSIRMELPATPIQVNADLVRLSQVFSNLLNNAAKYTDAGGTITITVRRENHQVAVSIRDTGIGIPEEMLSRIFEMFTQVDFERRRQDGLGIGLSLVRTLVQMHGGTVDARSEGLGCGSEFIVRLPLAASVPRERGKAASGPGNLGVSGKSLRILIVDDNKDSADSLSLLLRYFDADVRTDYNGEAALRTLETWIPTHILMDLGMPGMDGCETARQIRKNPAHREIILIALTGWGQEEDRRRSQAAGFNHHLVKPLDIQALTDLLTAKRPQNH